MVGIGPGKALPHQEDLCGKGFPALIAQVGWVEPSETHQRGVAYRWPAVGSVSLHPPYGALRRWLIVEEIDASSTEGRCVREAGHLPASK